MPKHSDVKGQHVVTWFENLRQVLDVFIATSTLFGVIVDATVVMYYLLLVTPGSCVEVSAAEKVLEIQEKGLGKLKSCFLCLGWLHRKPCTCMRQEVA